ncbi:MAG: DUF3078 domain-containing protein [Dysgonamonadaceae bacterium]|jgi:hypothetical protein|nr:DUF3078 domain-containing protein [Dysgonamonadaceae bacterium]
MKQFFTTKGFSVLFWTLMAFYPADLFSQEGRFPFNPYFLPPVFDGNFPNDTIIRLSLPEDSCMQIKFPATEWDVPISILTPQQAFIDHWRKDAYRNFLRHNISSVKYCRSDFSGEVEKIEQIQYNIFQNLFTVEADRAKKNFDRSTRYVPKRKYWITNWNSLLQFSQNYISKNWYNGGVGNLNLISVQKYTFNYQKNKIQFNNLIEWKLSFYTNPNDTLRSFRIGEDLVRTYSDLGLKAFKDKFFYSSNLEIKTKLFRSYKENSPLYTSALLSPLQVNMGIFGIKYQLNKTSKKDKNKKVNLAVDISPLSIQYTWVADSEVLAQNRYGIPADENFLLDVGSTLNAKITVNVNKQVTFSSRIKYFTNYEKVIFEAENELNMSLNRYFSTRLYLYGRFDDTRNIKRDERLGYVQLNEVLSFGFNYTW